MNASKSDLVGILETAIEVEKNGYDTFTKFLEKTKSEDGKKMFRKLADDEKEHRAILEKQLKELEEGKEFHGIEIPESEVEKLIPRIRDKQLRTKGEAGLGELDALNTALDLEKKTAQFFREKAEEVDNPEAKKLFTRLAEWEDSHYDLIMAQIDYIKNTGVWLGMPEFRMDGRY